MLKYALKYHLQTSKTYVNSVVTAAALINPFSFVHALCELFCLRAMGSEVRGFYAQAAEVMPLCWRGEILLSQSVLPGRLSFSKLTVAQVN